MMRKVEIKDRGIKNALSSVNIPKAIAEFIWNGFDANATTVEIIYEAESTGNLRKLIIKDNGSGIPISQLDDKFGPFYQSEKMVNDMRIKNKSLPHGYKGIGRLTFFSFANFATWTTVYEENSSRFDYSIRIQSKSLDNYLIKENDISKELRKTTKPTGTIVEFEGFNIIKDNKRNICEEIIEYLGKEFGWFLELFEEHNYQLLVNSSPLDYLSNIAEKEYLTFLHEETSTKFHVKYVQWYDFISEYSYYYYMDSTSNEKYKETTTLNMQGDNFYHSLYVKSDYFNDFNFGPIGNDQKQKTLIVNDRSSEIYKFIKRELDSLLLRKRRPFLKKRSTQIIEDIEKEYLFS